MPRSGGPDLLSVVVPVYNERRSLRTVLSAIDASPVAKEVVIVDDGSDDGTGELLRSVTAPHLTVIAHRRNYGKGAAIRTALEYVRGDYVIIQDADLEYDPGDYPSLLGPLRAGDVDVVYGVRPERPERGFCFHWGAKLLTWLTNLLYGARLHDEATCYKVFRRQVLDQLALDCVGFEFCPEVTGKLLRLGHRIGEVPISYRPRSRADGKKVTARDGWRAAVTLVRLRFTNPRSFTRHPARAAGQCFERTVLKLASPRWWEEERPAGQEPGAGRPGAAKSATGAVPVC